MVQAQKIKIGQSEKKGETQDKTRLILKNLFTILLQISCELLTKFVQASNKILAKFRQTSYKLVFKILTDF